MKILKFKNNTYDKLPRYPHFGNYYWLQPLDAFIGRLKIIIMEETMFYS
jgi:hypothetical protein